MNWFSRWMQKRKRKFVCTGRYNRQDVGGYIFLDGGGSLSRTFIAEYKNCCNAGAEFTKWCDNDQKLKITIEKVR